MTTYSTNKPLTTEERSKLTYRYAWRCINDTNIKEIFWNYCDQYALCEATAKSIAHHFDEKSDKYLIEKIEEFYPDLLDD